jgi:ABC-2 type transport system permease protein
VKRGADGKPDLTGHFLGDAGGANYGLEASQGGFLLPRARGIVLDLASDGTPRVLGGMVLLLVAMALLGLALGALLRRPVPALTVAVLVVLVLPVALVLAADLAGDPLAASAGVQPAQAAVNTAVTFLPAGAGSLLTTEGAVEGAPDLGPLGGGLVLAAWVAVPLALAGLRLRTQDVV